MTAVVLQSNPIETLSTHRWTSTGVGNLTADNKLSSLPFWIPNDRMRRHQLKLILVKDFSKPNFVDLLVELIPPPRPVSGSSEPAAGYPGGVNVSVKVIHRSDTSRSISASTAVELDAGNLQACFPALLSVEDAQSSDFTDEQGGITMDVRIQTEIHVVAAQVAKSVTSLWSAFSTSVSHFIDEAASTAAGAVAVSSSMVDAHVATPTPPPPPPAELPWEQVPKTWTDREQAWRNALLDTLPAMSGTFLRGPTTELTEEERSLLLQYGLSQPHMKEAYQHFNFDRDVHEGLLTSKSIREQRYQLVPAKVKEEQFWANYFWKVACLGLCESAEQAQLVISVLCAPSDKAPAPADASVKDSSVNRGAVVKELEQQVQASVEAADLLEEYVREGSSTDESSLLRVTMEACEGHAGRLEVLLRRSDLTEALVVDATRALQRLRSLLSQATKAMESRSSATPPHVTDFNTDAEPQGQESSEAPTVSPLTTSSPPPAPASVRATSQPALETTQVPSGSSPEVILPDIPHVSVTFPKMPWEEEDDDA